MASQNGDIILKPRDLLAIGCVTGIGLGVGIFGISHYILQNKNMNKTNSRPRKYLKQTSNDISTTLDFDDGKESFDYTGNTPTSVPRRLSRLTRQFSGGIFMDEDLNDLSVENQVKALKEQNTQLQNLLTMTENLKYQPSSDTLTPNDIETLRAIFDSIDHDEDGCIHGDQLKELYSQLGEPLTKDEIKKMLSNKRLIPDNSGQIAFSNFLPFWQSTHIGGKKGKEYRQKFKFIRLNFHDSFDIKNIILNNVGRRSTTEYRINFYYKTKSGQSKRISPWHDIPLHHLNISKNKQSKLYNFICEVPKWTRAKFEIATGESYNPIHQDVKNGKLRYYQHGDMMFNYGALPQTWENPSNIPIETECPGDNDPIDCIEIGTKQLKTGSVTPIKVLGVLALLDSGETDWKVLAININDELANKLNDVHDIEEHIPGAIKAIREYLRIYKVCTGNAENKYAFRGEALNQEFAINIIEETHEQWLELVGDNAQDSRMSKGTILTV